MARVQVCACDAQWCVTVRCGSHFCSWKAGADACTLAIDLHEAARSSVGGGSVSGDEDLCARATVRFKEADHVTLWISVLDWAVNAKVRLQLQHRQRFAGGGGSVGGCCCCCSDDEDADPASSQLYRVTASSSPTRNRLKKVSRPPPPSNPLPSLPDPPLPLQRQRRALCCCARQVPVCCR